MGKLSLSLTLAGFAALAAMPAAAQFNSIFGDPPRPPGAVPQQQFPQQQQQFPPQQFPQQQAPRQQQFPQQQQLPPPAPTSLPQQPPPPRGSAIESQPLPPPPGATTAPQPGPAPRPGAAAPAASAPPQLRGTPAPTDTAAQPGDEVVVEPPSEKVVNNGAVFAGLDKITGRIISFDVAIGETVQFGALQVTPRACYTRPPTVQQNTDGFVEVDEVTLQGEVKRLFTGWMFTASPGLHAVEHPIYDVWLTDCKSPQQPAVAAAPEPPAPSPRQPARPAAPRAQTKR